MLDASAVVDYLLRRGPTTAARDAILSGDLLHVPALCDIEVASALRRLMHAGQLESQRAGHALRDLTGLPLTRHTHLPLLGRILELRDNFSAYDATYVALAERLGARLLTTDVRLARAVRAARDVTVALV